MTNLLKWNDLDLPVFDSNEPLWHHFNLAGIAGSPQTSIVRHTEIGLPTDNCDTSIESLGQLITMAEDELGRLEYEFGVPSVPHEWGLYPLKAALDQDPRHQNWFDPVTEYTRYRLGYHLLPTGTLLAAKVVIVDQLAKPVGYSKEGPIIHYTAQAEGYFLSDLRRNQALYGKPRPNPHTTLIDEYIVDIEPRFGWTKLNKIRTLNIAGVR